MRRARFLRLQPVFLIAFGALLGGTGCIHNHYYGYPQSACGPTTSSGGVVVSTPGTAVTVAPGTSAYGSVCEVPSRVEGGTSVASSPSTSTATSPRVAASAPRTPQVIVSEPAGDGRTFHSGSRSFWRRTDPEAIATTRVEGAVEGTAVR